MTYAVKWLIAQLAIAMFAWVVMWLLGLVK